MNPYSFYSLSKAIYERRHTKARRLRAIARINRRDTTGVIAMNLKKALLHALEDKQVTLFEQKRKGDRKTDRHYTQVISAMDDLKRAKTHDTARSTKRRQQHQTQNDYVDHGDA